MDFGLSDEQRLLQDSVSRYLADACPLGRVRAAAAGDADVSRTLADGLRELGVTSILLPEQFGGAGLGLLDAAVVQQALGSHVAPVRYLASALLAPLALRGAGDAPVQAHWLPAMATGEVRLGVAINERAGAREGAGLRDNDGRLSGKSLFVLEFDDATHLLCADTDGVLHIVDVADAGLTARRLDTIDRTRTSFEVKLDKVPAVTLHADNAPGATVSRLLAASRVLLAADTLGAADAMLAQAVDYAGVRRQFGRTIGSFQAVKHLCAEMAARLEPCRALVWYAAHALDTGADDAPLVALLAKSHVAETGQFVARTATEVHGGMGFTDLLGLHYWFKRIGANRQLFGGPERLREEAARLQGWI